MKKAVFLFIGLLVAYCVLAQSYSIDSMKRILRSTSYVDSNKVHLCMQISNEWLKTNADSALVYANKSHDLALTLKHPNSLGDTRALQAKIYTILGKYDKAFELYLEALHKYNMADDYAGMGKVNMGLAKTFNKQDDYSKALVYFQNALNIFKSAGLKSELANTYMEIGLVHAKVNENEKALHNYQKALEVAQAAGDRRISINCYTHLGMLYSQTHNYNKSLKAFIRAKNLSLISGLLPSVAESYLNIGNTYRELGNYDSAHLSLDMALSYFTQLRNKEKIALTYDGIGALYFLEKEYAKATQSIKFSNQYALDIKNNNILQSNYEALLAIAKAEGNYQRATEYFDELLALKNNMFNAELNQSNQKLRAGYELEKKQAMILDLQEDNSNKTRQRNLFIIGFSIVAVSLLGLGFSIVQIKKNNKLLQVQKKELEELNLVKDKFFSIIGHDLRSPMANILGLLNLFSEDTSLSHDEKKHLFDKLKLSTASALETMDNMLAWGMNQIKESTTEISEVDVHEISQRVCRFLQQSADNKSVRLINHVKEPVKIYADKNHVEFILRNLISNALKFSHKNGVVELWASSGPVSKNIHIRDTGTGIPPEVKHKLFDDKKNGSLKGTAGETGSGLGLLLSKQFISKNKGSLSVKSVQGKGSVFTVSLPTI